MSAATVPDHAGRMDAIYRGQRHVYDATRKYYLLGRDRLIAELAPPPGGRVVELGCGTARNLIQAARRWPDAHFHGVDISNEMLATARAAVHRAGLGQRISLHQGDAAGFAPALLGEDRVERVFMSYTISMIPEWRRAIAAGAAALAPGGRLEIVDFGQQERLPDLWRKLLFAWLARFAVTPRADLPGTLRVIADAGNLHPAFTPLLRGYAWRATLTRPS